MKMKVSIDNKSYEVVVEDINARPVIAVVGGERFEVWPKSSNEERASLRILKRREISIPESSSAPIKTEVGDSAELKEVKAPLPGVIVTIQVKSGDSVSRGQELCTLEAMKMKNAIRANREGVIDTVEVAVGDQVGHGDTLMTFKD